MRSAVFADGAVGLRLLDWLISTYKQDITLVVTVAENEIYKLAKDKNIACVVFSTEKELVKYISDSRFVIDIGFLLWWPKIVGNALNSLAKGGVINTHPSLLPYNRGKNYNFWAIVEEAPFGVTLHFIDSGIDTGDIVAQQRIPYTWEDTGGTLYYRAQTAMVELFIESYPALRSKRYMRIKQDLSQGSFHKASELDPASRINLNEECQVRLLLNRIRARTFDGYPACTFEDNGEEFEVRLLVTRRNK